jgi:fructose-1,6-bisphosphatase I
MSRPVSRSSEWTGDPEVDAILEVVAEVVPEVCYQLSEQRSFLDEENPSGERTREADDYADSVFADRLLGLDAVASYASEERADQRRDSGTYHLAVDPLDGSSNLRSNNCMGTILGIYDEPLPTSGENLVAAAYVLYGPNTTVVVADGDTVTEYIVGKNERRSLREDVTLPADPTVYGVGGRRPDWTPGVASAVEAFEDDRLKLRYGGALIADFTQVLTHGGVFAYPELADRPEGKLRYQFECAPMGFVMESAGGYVSDGTGSLLEAEPDDIHERTPFYVGNAELVERFETELA